MSNPAFINGVAQDQHEVIEWSEDQKSAIDFVAEFMANKNRKNAVIGGVAGSGKSTIIPHIVKQYGGPAGDQVQVCAPTGKAALVLKRKGVTKASTLHSFLYYYKIGRDMDGNVVYTRYEKSYAEFIDISLVIVDEASMLNHEIYEFLNRLPFKVLYIGDHFQLPPVKDDFNIMKNPGFRMERILRQLEGNPIIMLAEMARRGESIPYGVYGDSRKVKEVDEADLVKYNQILVWTNDMKDRVNDEVRRILGLPYGVPVMGDRMIVRKNHRTKNLYNGQIVYLMGEPVRNKQGWYRVELMDEIAHDDAYVMANLDDCTKGLASIHIPKNELDNLFAAYSLEQRKKKKKQRIPDIHLDWGYAITVHSAQGSSWENVAVIEEPRMKYIMTAEEARRWRYTAITRAEKSVTLYEI